MDDPVQRLTARLERRGHDPAVAHALAAGAARKLAGEHPVWAVAAAVEDSRLVQKWVGANVHSFGPGRRGPDLDELLDEAIARHEVATARLLAALADLAAQG